MKKIMAANWKMFKTIVEAQEAAKEFVDLTATQLPRDREVVIFPPFTAISTVAETFSGIENFSVGGQDYYIKDEGAYTGEISPKMLFDAGATYGLAGHSERRHILGEDNDLVGDKTAFGVLNGLNVILCVGETIEERKAGKLEEVLTYQISTGLKNVPNNVSSESLCVAYEPVWAIGTGEVAESEEIVEAHTFVRKILISIFGDKANEIRVLYGGSVNSTNCSKIIALDNVDGVLVGGASLNGKSFSEIALA